jgi:hypothetical protein
MRSVPARVFRSFWIAVPAAALAAVIGATSAVAAPAMSAGTTHAHAQASPVTAARSPRLTWHRIKLVHGWKSASVRKLKTGTPAWAVSKGVVYLRGAIRQPNAEGSTVFTTLPKSARPAHTMYIQIYTSDDTPGILYINPSGEAQAYDGSAYTFASLANVSFQTARTRTHKLALTNAWTSSQPVYGTGDPAYDISHGVVYLSGSMHTTGVSELAFTLPRAARPARDMYLSVYSFDGDVGWLHILRNGQAYAGGPEAASFTSLATISFPVAKTRWHKFKLDDAWKSGASRFGTAAPEYAVINGVTYLNGSMYQSVTEPGLWTDLPKAARSVDVLEIEVYTFDGTAGSIAITNSLGLVSSMPFSNAQTMTSLAGVVYPPSE